MKKCRYCKSEIDSSAKICPNCRKKQGIPTWIIVAIVIMILAIIAATSSDNSTNNGDTNSKNSNGQIVEKFSHTVTNEYSDSFTHYIEGTVTNNKDKNYSYVQIEFICYDAAGNNLGTALDNTNNLLGKQTWKYKAMAFFSGEENIDHCDFHEISGW